MTHDARESQSHVDPVCGMTVDPENAAGSSTFGGKTIYFCSAGCKQKFDADPGKFLDTESEPAIDPVCGMTVDRQKAAGSSTLEGKTYSFCSAGCKEKFDADPGKFVTGSGDRATRPSEPAAPGTSYVCPMDPEVRQDKPGACPKCGMALEPEQISAAGLGVSARGLGVVASVYAIRIRPSFSRADTVS